MKEEAELKNLYGISSIWTTIRTFKSIVHDLIDYAMVVSIVVEMSMTEEKETTIDPTKVPVRADED